MTRLLSISSLLDSVFLGNYIASISGESGLGKTTLALQLAGYLLGDSRPSCSGQCIWVQASEKFPLQRLCSLYTEQPEILSYLKRNILVYPTKKPFSNYGIQHSALECFTAMPFPPELKVIVVDNISHHLRYQLMQCEDPSSRSKLLDEFYATQLFPLITWSQRERVYLILIHEASYHVKERATKPFFSQLYDRLELLTLALSRALGSLLNLLELRDPATSTRELYYYEITDRGLFGYKTSPSTITSTI